MASYVKWSPGKLFPQNAVQGGIDSDGSKIYVGRAWHNGDLIPAKVIPERDATYISYAGKEIFANICEILVGPSMPWLHCSNGNVPPKAIKVGKTAAGEPLYVGRVYHNGSHTVGKVHTSHGCCYIPYNGNEISYRNYEVLFLK